MAARKKTTKRKPSGKRRPRQQQKRRVAGRTREPGSLVNFVIPLVFIVCIVFCLGFLTFMGYRTVTASAFFDVRSIDVRGTNRAPREAIENIVRRESLKTGVWNADLGEIKREVERLTFVKTAAVSRILPNGVRVDVVERIPRVAVQLNSGIYWADEEAVLLGKIGRHEPVPPFVLRGWSRPNTAAASRKANRQRVRVYLQMLEDWQAFEVAKRVRAVDLSDPRKARAIVTDSGRQVSVLLGGENFGKRLRDALKELAGKGETIGMVISDGEKLVAIPRSG